MPRRLVDLRQHASGVILLPSVNQHVFPFGGAFKWHAAWAPEAGFVLPLRLLRL